MTGFSNGGSGDAHSDRPMLSLYIEAYQEAQRHKWIESVHAKRDVGDSAIRDWYAHHWIDFCKRKRLEHVHGVTCWKEYEFGPGGFGGLNDLILAGDLLVDRILDRFYCGQENLEVLCWAHDWNIDTDRVIDILEMININCARLEPAYA